MNKQNQTVNLSLNKDYKNWLKALKQKVLSTQLKAAVQVNSTLLAFYWELGEDIVRRQAQANWGDGFLKQLSKDLMAEFPEIKGFSERNLKYIRQWFLYYSGQQAIGQQAVAQLMQVPWGHNLQIISKCKSVPEALYYVRSTIEHGWSRSVLTHQIESGLWQREGQAISNFNTTLPAIQSDLAQQTLKDPYVFDFLSLTQNYNEREFEQGLTEHITQFLLELGAGFAYVGKQFHIQVGQRDFYIDLLFYHIRLHCYVVIELKTVDFEPEHAGKLNFYIRAVDELLRKEGDTPTIGILLCKNKDKLVAEYSLSDMQKPIGVSEYQLTQSLPENLQSQLPSVEEIEQELRGGR
ncbi:YhcG family protein [Endozoicomonas sp. 8E]|uniref:PDDEXK nuclease domain-containing protein n=1 Tax=Endozoicomonas sp. 8E TaxID=3035692 RepID=UPI00293904FC|nr:PDDEXK nuclease domain-containing protein [Endozoicomonas sp. 8E]WOG27145.1 PDDEXK nuclease domain-containing protein [Endozoicomonas sp. 8E]